MKKYSYVIGSVVLAMALVFAFTACDNGTTSGGGGEGSGGGGGDTTTYNIGDTGPGGGKVFYAKSSYSDGWRYLEVSPAVLGEISWSSTYANVAGLAYETSSAIGKGKSNTAAIIAAHPGDTAANNAAKACADYRGPNDKDDWFLPSIWELQEIYEQGTAAGITLEEFAWSSSQDGTLSYDNAAHYAYAIYFGNGNQNNFDKDSEFNVVAIRSF